MENQINRLILQKNTGVGDVTSEDLVWLPSKESYEKIRPHARRKSPTDYAKLNGVVVDEKTNTRTGNPASITLLRDCKIDYGIYEEAVSYEGKFIFISLLNRMAGIPVCCKMNLPEDISKLNIRAEKRGLIGTLYHTLDVGGYLQEIVKDNSLKETLEDMYNGGNLREGITCTGRWYSDNAQKKHHPFLVIKRSPEFEYQGNRYVRFIPSQTDILGVENDENVNRARWLKVESVPCIIRNWNSLTPDINPAGNGKDTFFELETKDLICGNIPCYPRITKEDIEKGIGWANSPIRRFLNDVVAEEIFNPSREPVIEYTMLDWEKEIPDDGFNGCIMLKKIVIPPNIKRIGKRAFEGVNFKYAYKTSTGEVVFAEKLPENPEECLDVISIEELKTAFDGFDYNILLQREKYAEIKKLAETLNKNKFSIPYAYGDELIRSGNGQQFNENADFRFFKSEIPNIQELLSECSEEEKVSFFKFAFTLGCFSTERMTDKNGKETSIMIGQKASSILAQILKNPKMKLR